MDIPYDPVVCIFSSIIHECYFYSQSSDSTTYHIARLGLASRMQEIMQFVIGRQLLRLKFKLYISCRISMDAQVLKAHMRSSDSEGGRKNEPTQIRTENLPHI